MPVTDCTENGRPGYRCGQAGKCYTYSGDGGAGKGDAWAKACAQCRAMDEECE